MTALSVIICTHKPRSEPLRQALQALSLQNLPIDQWELLIVANGDTTIQPGGVPESLRQHIRIAHEPELGLTPARLRGIAASKSDLIVFVDDDNVLDPGYLSEAVALARRHPQLGAFGGRATPVYEAEPLPELRAIADLTALKRDLDRPRWSNLYDASTCPFGAGMVVRRTVANQYVGHTQAGSSYRSLDRSGDLPGFCGDSDLAWTAIDIGMGCGVFPSLHFLHLIPANRVTRQYLLSVTEGFTFSWMLLHRLRGLPLPDIHQLRPRIKQGLDWWRYLRSSPTQRAFTRARWLGEGRALATKL